MAAPIDPTEAQRLGRLRTLLLDARRRVGDESELGIHLAVIAIDGVGELAIGLCLQHCGIRPKQTDGLPARLSRLIKKLEISPSGSQGFRELHDVRNLAQHAGVLPAPEQLPRWLSETEMLIDVLIEATFGLGLAEVGAASGVKDQALQALLEQAERALDQNEAGASFDASWKALEHARRKFREETGLHRQPGISGITRQLQRLDRGLGNLPSEVEALSDQIELSAFTAEPGEWLWFRQRQNERFRGLPPTAADAKRAFVFVLSWILWFESYISRHSVDRWERWREEQQPPKTGVPGGPHIAGVNFGDRSGVPGGRTENLRQWVFQLTDIPETEPSFDWAVVTALDQLDDSSLTAAYLELDGHLAISCPNDLDPAAVKAAVEELLEKAKALLRIRAAEEAQNRQLGEPILRRFEEGLRQSDCRVRELRLKPPESDYRVDPIKSTVWINLDDPTDGGGSWFSKGLEETFDRHFPEYLGRADQATQPYQSGWYDVAVPASWDPQRVGAWVKEAAKLDRDKREHEAAERNQSQQAAQQDLEEMRELLRGDSAG